MNSKKQLVTKTNVLNESDKHSFETTILKKTKSHEKYNSSSEKQNSKTKNSNFNYIQNKSLSNNNFLKSPKKEYPVSKINLDDSKTGLNTTTEIGVKKTKSLGVFNQLKNVRYIQKTLDKKDKKINGNIDDSIIELNLEQCIFFLIL